MKTLREGASPRRQSVDSASVLQFSQPQPLLLVTTRPTFATISSVSEPHHTTTPSTAADQMPKTWELEQRVARLEIEITELHAALDIQTKRTISLQAHLDHLIALLSIR